MADQLQLRGGTTAEHATFTGALREVTVDTDKDTVVVHDNATVGGHPLAKENLSNVAAATAATKLDGQTIKFGGGSAATPSLTFNGDLNTGIYSPGADQVAISTNGTGRLFVDSSGNVGVGASGSYPLDVSRGAGNGISARFRNSGGSAGYVYNSGTDVVYFTGDTSANNAIGFNSTGNYVSLFSGNGTERLRITSAGLVGVGTSSPSRRLHVVVSGTGNVATFESDAGPNLAFVGTEASGRTYLIGEGLTAAGLFQVYDSNASAARLTINSSGNVGVGTTSPSAALHVAAANNSQLFLAATDANATTIIIDTDAGASERVRINNKDGALTFDTNNNAERARIDSSGRLLVGTSSSASAGDSQYAKFQVKGNTYNASGNGILSLQSGTTTPSSGLILGSVLFADNTGGEYGRIDCHVDATAGTNDYPGRLVFSTTADGASSPTERMRITEAGEIWINRTTRDAVVGSGCKLQVLCTGAEWSTVIRNSNGATPYGLYIKHDVDANTNTNSFWVGNGGGVNRGYLASNGGLYNYSGNNSNLCDEREKKNIENLESTWDCLKHWELKKFHYNEDADTEIKRYGVIAQQVEQHCPEVITEWTKGKNEDGEDILRKGVKEQQMYWMAIKALQEAQVRIEQLEAKVAALEGA